MIDKELNIEDIYNDLNAVFQYLIEDRDHSFNEHKEVVDKLSTAMDFLKDEISIDKSINEVSKEEEMSL